MPHMNAPLGPAVVKDNDAVREDDEAELLPLMAAPVPQLYPRAAVVIPGFAGESAAVAAATEVDAALLSTASASAVGRGGQRATRPVRPPVGHPPAQ